MMCPLHTNLQLLIWDQHFLSLSLYHLTCYVLLDNDDTLCVRLYREMMMTTAYMVRVVHIIDLSAWRMIHQHVTLQSCLLPPWPNRISHFLSYSNSHVFLYRGKCRIYLPFHIIKSLITFWCYRTIIKPCYLNPVFRTIWMYDCLLIIN